MIKDKLGDYKKIVNRGDLVLTDFLDFEEQKEIYALESTSTVVNLFGGFDGAERKRALVGHQNVITDDFEIVIFLTNHPETIDNLF